MLTVKKGCEELDNWNKKAKNLVLDLENTIAGFSKLLHTDKENFEGKSRTIPVKAFQILTESKNCSQKADPTTIKEIIRVGIYKLRKSPMPQTRTSQSSCFSFRNSFVEPVVAEKKNKRSKKKKNTTQRGRSHERCKISLFE